jgi:hypothetical protein
METRLERVRVSPVEAVRGVAVAACFALAWLTPAVLERVVAPDRRFAAVFGLSLLLAACLGFVVWKAPQRGDALLRVVIAAGTAWAALVTAAVAAWALAVSASLCGTRPFLRYLTATPTVAIYLVLGYWILRTRSHRSLWTWPLAIAAATAAFLLFQVFAGGNGYCTS